MDYLDMPDDEIGQLQSPVFKEPEPLEVPEPEPAIEPEPASKPAAEPAPVQEPVVEPVVPAEPVAPVVDINALDMADDDLWPAGYEGKPTADAEVAAAAAKVAEEAAAPVVEPTEEVDKPVVEAPVEDANKTFAEKVMAPFKANGREMQVKTPEEAVQLMQMGANYNKKMAALKPNLAYVRQLEQAGLLSDEKIGFLIDLSKKNPEAIGKLLKDSGVDPVDLDEKAVEGYKPTSYAESPTVTALNEVLDSLQESPTYNQLIDYASNGLDVASQKIVAATPQVLGVINDHMARGFYDTITNEVERRKALGQLSGVPDLEAYWKVGDELNAAGAFNPKEPQAPAVSELAPVVKVIVAAPAAQANAELAARRRAAAPSKAAAPTTAPIDFNPLNMSDEEISKMGKPNFM